MPLSDGAIMGLDWGNIPVWVGVILTSASVGIAARTYVLNSRRAIREQASQVTVELHVPEIAPDILHTVEVTNHSAASIWRVRLEVHRFTTVEYSPREAVVRPGDSLIFTTEPFWWEKFAPGSASGAMRAPVYGIVTFVDAQGYEWRRSSTGVLVPPPRAGFGRRGGLGRFYKFRKAFVPKRIRHWFRDRSRAYLSAKPMQYRDSKNRI
jgi:hypothetical protein